MTDVDEEQPEAIDAATLATPAGTVSPLLFVVGGIVLIAAVVLIAVLARDGGGGSATSRTDEQNEVASVAGAVAEAILSYDYENMDAALTRVEEHLGGEFKEIYAETFEQVQTPLIVELQAVAVATVQDVFLTDISDTSARAIVEVDQVVSSTLGRRTLDDVYLLFTLTKGDDDVWRVAEIPLRIGGDEQTFTPAEGTGEEPDATTTTAP